MNKNIVTIILEQLRLLREDIRDMNKCFRQMNGCMDNIETELHGHRKMVLGLSTGFGLIDNRVEALEARIGG